MQRNRFLNKVYSIGSIHSNKQCKDFYLPMVKNKCMRNNYLLLDCISHTFYPESCRSNSNCIGICIHFVEDIKRHNYCIRDYFFENYRNYKRCNQLNYPYKIHILCYYFYHNSLRRSCFHTYQCPKIQRIRKKYIKQSQLQWLGHSCKLHNPIYRYYMECI